MRFNVTFSYRSKSRFFHLGPFLDLGMINQMLRKVGCLVVVRVCILALAAYCWPHRLGWYLFTHPTLVAVRERTQAASESAPMGRRVWGYWRSSTPTHALLFHSNPWGLAWRCVAEAKRMIPSVLFPQPRHVMYPAPLIDKDRVVTYCQFKPLSTPSTGTIVRRLEPCICILS
ncbi:hypothetical protein F5146DRAFT_53 [Armillaria mellea]|nr:hypothetical protein F5146DRAFT_53 [Armillaria mellea]